MAGAGFSTLTAEWVDGALVIYDSAHTAVVTLNSSGLNWVGGVTISSAILVAAPTLSTANLSTSTLSVANISTATMSVATISTATMTTSALNGSTISGSTITTSVLSASSISTSTLSGAAISIGTISAAQLSVCTISTATFEAQAIISSAALVSVVTSSTAGIIRAPQISGGSTFEGTTTISSAVITGTSTISSATFAHDVTFTQGVITYTGEVTKSVVGDTTLTVSGSGCVLYVTASDATITLPGVASSGVALYYTIVNKVSTAGQIVIKTTTTELIKGGIATSTGVDILANTGATHIDGDFVSLIGNPASTSWSMVGLVGVWASTT